MMTEKRRLRKRSGSQREDHRERVLGAKAAHGKGREQKVSKGGPQAERRLQHEAALVRVDDRWGQVAGRERRLGLHRKS